jgi:hypothetical protein
MTGMGGWKMMKYLAAVALATVLGQPASAITFSKLTTIYIGAGVSQFDGAVQSATAFTCSNVSGQTANVRVLVLNHVGEVAGSHVQALVHGANLTVATSNIPIFNHIALGTGSVIQGTVNIESTQSGVFCNAMILGPDAIEPTGVALNLVRVNPHPGTVE